MDGTTAAEQRSIARRIGGALEPVIGSVYFSPECHQAYAELGFDASPGEFAGVPAPEASAYCTSRGSLLGQVPGEVVAAAFAVFNPEHIAAGVEHGWTLTDAATIRDCRDRGALAQLERVLGPEPAGRDRVVELLERATANLSPTGRPLFAGALSMPITDHPLGAVFRYGDRLREYRGDSHNAAWISEGLNGTEIGLLTELYWGLPLRSYSRTRSWSEEQFDEAEARLIAEGWIANGGFTTAGRELRESIERRTDAQMRPLLEALGPDATQLVDLLTPWGAAIREANGYPASGPHDLADAGSR